MGERLNLVTGACGFCGSHLVKLLLDNGEKVIATDLAKAFEHPKNKFIFERIGLDFNHPNCKVIPANLLEPKTLKPLFKKNLTHIFHTASLYDYSASMEILRKINIEGSVNLFDLAVKHKKLERFIHWSTCGIFGKPYTARDGKKCNVPFSEECSSPRNTPFEQDQPTGSHLVNDYSVTKWKQEQIAWKYHREKGLPLTVVRPAPLYGPGSDYGHGGIVLTINRGMVPIIPADSRNYITTSIHVDDMAGFAYHISDKDYGLGEDYNVVDDSVISYADFLQYLALLLGRRMWRVPLLYMPLLRPFMIGAAKLWLWLEQKYKVPRLRVFEVQSATYMSSSYWITNRKIRTTTDYKYLYPDVNEGMRDTIEWFRDAGWLDRKYNPKGIWQENL
ncbi:MAG: NAD(P)-dependent oxidoreductase [Candidatus Alcyoniella australis]|nr:NAD(P)-dependent oxidoreductase [Candidatus Alcyoniella australis]